MPSNVYQGLRKYLLIFNFEICRDCHFKYRFEANIIKPTQLLPSTSALLKNNGKHHVKYLRFKQKIFPSPSTFCLCFLHLFSLLSSSQPSIYSQSLVELFFLFHHPISITFSSSHSPAFCHSLYSLVQYHQHHQTDTRHPH